MKIKHKGKIYPSPSSSSSSSSSVSLPSPCSRDVLSVMKLLPAAILALASVLSLEDREVLAYMIMRSLDSSNMSSVSSDSSKGTKKSSKKHPSGGGGAGGGGGAHRPPVFGCDCFDCYTSYWLRWDSSSNRELIHQVIEAFEEHLTTGEASFKRAGRGKRREKPGRRVASQPEPAPPPAQLGEPAPDQSCPREAEVVSTAGADELCTVGSTENEVVPVTSPEVEKQEAATEAVTETEEAVECGGPPELVVVAAATGGSPHKGLARKVLPDVLGLLNSRLWNLWNPNV